MEGSKEDGARLFSEVSSNRTRGKKQKLKYRKFCLNIRKCFFNCKDDCTLEQDAQRGCGVSNLADIQNPTGQGSEQPAPGGPDLSRELD